MINNIPYTTPEEEPMIQKKIAENNKKTMSAQTTSFFGNVLNPLSRKKVPKAKRLVQRDFNWFSKFVDGRQR